jgi:hypothetical protein
MPLPLPHAITRQFALFSSTGAILRQASSRASPRILGGRRLLSLYVLEPIPPAPVLFTALLLLF